MQDYYGDSGVFIRSMATRGHLGGVAGATFDLALLLDAAGAGTVLIETVGVGQDEIDIARLATVTVVVLVPGMGDDVQAMKAGIMEVADVFVINKADYDGADRLASEIHAAQPNVPVVRTVGTEARGIEELLAAIRNAGRTGREERREMESWRWRLRELVRERLLERLPADSLDREAAEVARRHRDPYTAVHTLIKEIL